MPRPPTQALEESAGELMLVSIAGPHPVQHALEPGRTLTIGRRPVHGLVLDRPEVSRDHAEIRCVELPGSGERQWLLTDLHSRHKTRLNGLELRADEPCPMRIGDLIEISPWTFRLVDSRAAASHSTHERQVRTFDDAPAASMRTISEASGDLAQERLQLLLRFAVTIGNVSSEIELAQALLEAAVRGTSFPNAAVLRPLMPDGTVSVIAETGAISAGGNSGIDEAPARVETGGRRPRLSRTLIRQASLGAPVQIGGDALISPEAHSMVEFHIHEAICVPLMLEGAPAAFLYLDARDDSEHEHATRRSYGSARRKLARDAGLFATGLARFAVMALLNMHRRDLEKRYARIEGELAAAARTQRMILPGRELTVGSLHIIGECRPGRVVSGDFFDVIALDEGRVAIALGDVAGKGIEAAVLMTTTQGFLHGVLAQHGEASRAISDLNDYLEPRCDAGRFISLWLGVIDPAAKSIEYVNAGHGLAWLVQPGGNAVALNEGGGPLVGVLPGLPYRAMRSSFANGDRLLLVSDGIVEQPRGADRNRPFGWKGVQACLTTAGEDEATVTRIFEAVLEHAANDDLADDATIVTVTLRT